MKTINNLRRAEKGQSLVELAMSLVLIIVLLGGVVDLGRALFTYLSLRDAVEEGIVYGTAFPTKCDEIRNRVKYNYANGLLPDSLTVEVLVNYGACGPIPAAGDPMEITITHQFPITMPFLGSIIGQEIEMTAKATGVILRQ